MCSCPGRRRLLSLLFFHLRDGRDILLDPDGRNLEGRDAIATAALTEARAIIASEALVGRINLEQHIDVEDADRNVIHSLRFTDAIELVLSEPQPAPTLTRVR